MKANPLEYSELECRNAIQSVKNDNDFSIFGISILVALIIAVIFIDRYRDYIDSKKKDNKYENDKRNW